LKWRGDGAKGGGLAALSAEPWGNPPHALVLKHILSYLVADNRRRGALDTRGRITKDGIRIYEEADFDGMRKAGRLAAEILDRIIPHVQPGVTTAALDKAIEEMVNEAGATSATIGYKGYRHATCISLNHVVCHGIPGSKVPKGKNEKSTRHHDELIDGDILNIDVTVIVDGWFGDTSRMYKVGTIKPFAERLIDVTHEALMRGIAAVKPGNTFGDIGHAIQSFVEQNRMSVVRDFCGHGLGEVFHAPPNVLHYGKPGTGAVLEEGMFFTIEPMVNLGRPETKVLGDDWTAITRDKTLSAQFEHSIGVTATGAEIFTLSPAGKFFPTWS
jgi:methionyl aminopeptidase